MKKILSALLMLVLLLCGCGGEKLPEDLAAWEQSPTGGWPTPPP